MSRRGVTVVGLAAAGGVGYYLYTAGGDPKVAQKNFKGLFLPYDSYRTAHLMLHTSSRRCRSSSQDQVRSSRQREGV